MANDPVQAADASKAAGGLEEIVVTAQRSSTNLQRTPISVTAFTAADLKRRGAVDLLDLSVYTPNLSINSRPGFGSARSSFSIRGMGITAADSTASVGVYVDEVYFPSTFGNILGLLDVQRIEVLRGPQGTLFGRNTIAGAIQYIGVKPGPVLGGYVEATGGNLKRRSITGALNVPLADALAVRFAWIYDHRGGFVTDDLNGNKYGGSTIKGGRVSLRFTPVERLTVDLRGDLVRQQGTGRPVAVIGVNPNAQLVTLAANAGETRPLTTAYVSARDYHIAGFNSPDYFRSKEQSVAGTIAYDISDALKFKAISAYQKNVNHQVTDYDMTPLSIYAFDAGTFTDKVFSQEVQLVGKLFDERLKYTFGVYYFDAQQTVLGSTQKVGLGAPAPATDTRLVNKSLAAYGQATVNLTDQLAVVAGIRRTHEKVRNANLTVGAAFSSSFTDTSPTIGFNFQVTRDALLYVKASKGFRAGGLTVSALLPGGNVAFAPETAWTYEAGARLEFLNHRLRINPTIFFTDWKNIQFNLRQAFGTNLVIVTQNAGSAHLKGGELEAQFAASNRLSFTGSLSVLDSHYTQVPSIPLTIYPLGYAAFLRRLPGSSQTVANLDINQPLAQAPKFKYAVGARYALPLDDGAKLAASVDWGWTSKQRSTVTTYSSITVPAAGLLSARLQYDLPGGHASIAVFGTNLLDKYYYIGGNAFGKSYSIGADEADLGRPRECGATLRVGF